MSRRLPFCSGGWNIDLSSSNWGKLLLYPPVFIFTKKHCVDEFPLLTTDLWNRSLFFPLQKEVTLSSRGIFLIPDSSRQTVTTRGKARREKKITCCHRSYESHFQAILGSYIWRNRFGADVNICFYWLWQLKFDCTWLCSLPAFVAWRFWSGVQSSHKGGRGQ